MIKTYSIAYNIRFMKKEKRFNMMKVSTLLFFTVLVLLFFIFCAQDIFNLVPKQVLKHNSIISVHQQNDEDLFKVAPEHALKHNSTTHQKSDDDHEKCDLSKGHWVEDKRGSLYTNWTCKTIPDSKNCFLYGRKDRGFVNWRWKPDQCELPRFDPKIFLKFVIGKKLAFIGDSVARNHMESLLCLLSKEEVPIDVYKDSEDRFRTWHFPNYNFTLMVLWSKFLVVEKEKIINGTNSGIYDLQLDKVDEKWTRALSDLDFAVISDAHWFFRTLYLYKGEDLIGCVYCNKPDITDYKSTYAIQMSLRTALNHINNCEKCDKMVTILRTFAPAHFEHGGWNTGGKCNRTRPLNEDELGNWGKFEYEVRGVQVEEFKRARDEKMKRIEIMDVTRAMLARPDGHPNTNWDNKYVNGATDCVHWCLPGPIDSWSDFLLAMLKKV